MHVHAYFDATQCFRSTVYRDEVVAETTGVLTSLRNALRTDPNIAASYGLEEIATWTAIDDAQIAAFDNDPTPFFKLRGGCNFLLDLRKQIEAPIPSRISRFYDANLAALTLRQALIRENVHGARAITGMDDDTARIIGTLQMEDLRRIANFQESILEPRIPAKVMATLQELPDFNDFRKVLALAYSPLGRKDVKSILCASSQGDSFWRDLTMLPADCAQEKADMSPQLLGFLTVLLGHTKISNTAASFFGPKSQDKVKQVWFRMRHANGHDCRSGTLRVRAEKCMRPKSLERWETMFAIATALTYMEVGVPQGFAILYAWQATRAYFGIPDRATQSLTGSIDHLTLDRLIPALREFEDGMILRQTCTKCGFTTLRGLSSVEDCPVCRLKRSPRQQTERRA